MYINGAGFDFATQTGGIGLDAYYLNIFNGAMNLDAAGFAREMDAYGITPTDVVNAFNRYAPGSGMTLEIVVDSYVNGGGRNPDFIAEAPSEAPVTTVPSWFDAARFASLSPEGKADAYNELIFAGYTNEDIFNAAVAAFGPQPGWTDLLLLAAARRGDGGLFVEEAEVIIEEREDAAAAAEQARLQAIIDEQNRIAAALEADRAAAAAAQANEIARLEAERAAAAEAKAATDALNARLAAEAATARANADAAAVAAAKAAQEAAAAAAGAYEPRSLIPETPRRPEDVGLTTPRLPVDIQPQQATGGNAGLLLAAGLAALTLLG